jgi:hypothetical protein
MKRILILAATLLAASLGAYTAEKPAQPVAPLQLFGIDVKGASRARLRTALKIEGLEPVREDDALLSDAYRGADGRTSVDVVYQPGTRIFAWALYRFPSKNDPDQVRRVIEMVSMKYGRPTDIDGDYQGGEVTGTWDRSDGTRIQVYREWPDTTTYLSLVDTKGQATVLAYVEAFRAGQKPKKSS